MRGNCFNQLRAEDLASLVSSSVSRARKASFVAHLPCQYPTHQVVVKKISWQCALANSYMFPKLCVVGTGGTKCLDCLYYPTCQQPNEFSTSTSGCHTNNYWRHAVVWWQTTGVCVYVFLGGEASGRKPLYLWPWHTRLVVQATLTRRQRLLRHEAHLGGPSVHGWMSRRCVFPLLK